jgi:hypothetical protein
MTRHRWDDEHGTISGFTAVLAAAVLAMAGLAYDGGQLVTTATTARQLAGAAARAGAQQLAHDAAHTGTTRLDTSAARTAAAGVLAAHGHPGGSVSVAGDRVQVTVAVTYRPRLLPIGERTVTVTGHATATSDVLSSAA